MTKGNGDPVLVGETAQDVLSLAYHEQLLAKYWETDRLITRNALVSLAILAKRFDERARYVLLEDSDQGSWQYMVGLSQVLPVAAGDYVQDVIDPDDEFDDDGWASNLGDRAEDVWLEFCSSSESMPHWKFLDIERVLAEVSVPWRPAPGAEVPCRHEGGSADCPYSCLLVHGSRFLTSGVGV